MTRSYPHSAFNHGCTTRHGTMFNDLNLIDLGNTRKTIANRMQNYAVFIFESKSNGKCNKWAWLHAIELTNFRSFRLIRRMINEPRTSGVESTWVKLDSHQWSTFQTRGPSRPSFALLMVRSTKVLPFRIFPNIRFSSIQFICQDIEYTQAFQIVSICVCVCVSFWWLRPTQKFKLQIYK